ncbi:MAG: hypothetical protein U0T36_11195 [Saprospiraceae bacterium]
MKGLVIFHFLIFVWSISCQTHKYTEQKNSSSPTLSQDSKFINMHGDTIKKVNKTPEEWRKSLTDMEYHVLREKVQNELSQVTCSTIKMMVCTLVEAVACRYL